MLYRKIILVRLLLISISNYVSCYSYQAVSKEEFLSANDGDVSLRIEYKNTYLFSKGDYSVSSDTIWGKGKLKELRHSYEVYHDFEGNLSLSDIKEIKIRKTDTALTIAVIVIPVGLVIWLAASFDPFDGPLVGN